MADSARKATEFWPLALSGYSMLHGKLQLPEDVGKSMVGEWQE